MHTTPKTAQVLSHYRLRYRIADGCGIVLFAVLAAWSLLRLVPAAGELEWLFSAALAGWLAADLLSGVVHWAFDTWGSVHTPVLGKRFIRPFREHHWDPAAMTRHDFVETSGSSCLAALPVLAATALMPLSSPAAVGVQAVLLFTAIGVLLTNQCHRWAHMPAGSVPRLARAAQRLRLILRPEDHLQHHVRPFDSHYCTASGWLNAPLQAIGLFRRLERCIGVVLRAQARRDDLG
ncbi:MAG TPA: fatty acid desaturase CarF family protein [Burkholderiales bacterium]|nr:fatty acid desaturase CarF family protein [Burkholderiales bacterium]